MHEQNGNKPGSAEFLLPNEKWITDFQQPNRYASDRQKMFKPDEGLCGNKIEWRPS
jgi:hypothetical protein